MKPMQPETCAVEPEVAVDQTHEEQRAFHAWPGSLPSGVGRGFEDRGKVSPAAWVRRRFSLALQASKPQNGAKKVLPPRCTSYRRESGATVQWVEEDL